MCRSPEPQRPTVAAMHLSASKKKSKSSSKKPPPKHDNNNTANHGERYHDFCEAIDNAEAKTKTKIKEMIPKYFEYLKDKKKTCIKKTVTGKKHTVYLGTSKDALDLRVTIPKSKNFGTNQDGQGLASLLKEAFEEADLIFRPKMTLTWLSAYAAGIRVDVTKEGWQMFECSHLCCDYDENGKRLQGCRCIDPDCLTFEDKSTNQGRANHICRKKCHCGCGKTVCEANNYHNPPCR